VKLSAVEICAGGGGQALGLEMAGFDHEAVVEYEARFCETLQKNRPQWHPIHKDIRDFNGTPYREVDLLAGGVPCPPFSIAGKQRGANDERDMFPTALSLVEQIKPRAVMLENVPGFASAKFEDYRNELLLKLSKLGYQPEWRVLNASDFGVPQLRPRFVLVALRPIDAEFFRWPAPNKNMRLVGETLLDLMQADGWLGAEAWAQKAAAIAPTLVGGSKLHGGPDLGPTRAKRQWQELGVDGMGIANAPPPKDFPIGAHPRLTLRMVARIQSFPDDWEFAGGKTAAYRQIGNAFPPLVAKAMGRAIKRAIQHSRKDMLASADTAFEERLLDEPKKYITGTRKKSKR
jgi:DNA (cytosine-5)-methyltransferase 1